MLIKTNIQLLKKFFKKWPTKGSIDGLKDDCDFVDQATLNVTDSEIWNSDPELEFYKFINFTRNKKSGLKYYSVRLLIFVLGEKYLNFFF